MPITDHPTSRILLTGASIVVIAAGIKAAQAIVVPFLLALMLALIFSPLMTWLVKRSVPTGIAILLVLLVLLVGGSILGVILGSSINDFVRDLPQFQERLQALTANSISWLDGIGMQEQAEEALSSFNLGSVLGLAGSALASLSGLMTNAFLILLTTAFLLGEGLVLKKKIQLALGDREQVLPAFEQIEISIQNYMGLKTIISFGTGVVVFLWLWFLGVEYAVMWGLLAFLLNYIPNVGSLIAAIPAVLYTLVQAGSFTAMLVALGYLLINVVIGSVIEPRVMGRGLDLSPLVVFVSLIFWGFLLGPVGMLLSVPLTVVIKLMLETSDNTRTIAILLGSAK